MKSLLELISKHSESNSIIPLIALVAVAFIIIIYVLFKPKWIKYVLSIIVLVVGGIVFYNGYKEILDEVGLDLIITGAKILTFGIVAGLFSMVMDILDSLGKMFKRKKKEEKQENPEKDSVENVEEQDLVDDKDQTKDFEEKTNVFNFEELKEDEEVVDATAVFKLEEDVKKFPSVDDTKIMDSKLEDEEIQEDTIFVNLKNSGNEKAHQDTIVIDAKKIKKKTDKK